MRRLILKEPQGVQASAENVDRNRHDERACDRERERHSVVWKFEELDEEDARDHETREDEEERHVKRVDDALA